MSSRDKILSAIREAKKTMSQIPDDPNVESSIARQLKNITPDSYEGLRDQFKFELEKISGEFNIVKNEKECATSIAKLFANKEYSQFMVSGDERPLRIAEQIIQKNNALSFSKAVDFDYPERKDKLASVPAAIIDATYAVADTATLCIPFQNIKSHLPIVLPECTVAVITPDQLIANHFELFDRLTPDEAKNMVLVTGASRTADIEKILFLGAHGPRHFVVYMLEK